jgi:hypothetical protein
MEIEFYDLNLGALGTFSPLNILSAPTFLPLLGHPYFGPKTLLISLHEMLVKMIVETNRRDNIVLPVFMGIAIKRIKLTNIIQYLQYGGKSNFQHRSSLGPRIIGYWPP